MKRSHHIKHLEQCLACRKCSKLVLAITVTILAFLGEFIISALFDLPLAISFLEPFWGRGRTQINLINELLKYNIYRVDLI